MISCSPACQSLSSRNALPAWKGVMPGLDPSPAMTKAGEDKEQAGREGPVPGAGGRPKDTGTCSSARTDARSCSIRTLPGVPPALATPAGGTRRPSAPPGTSLRTLQHLNSRSCFVLERVGARVKARPPTPSSSSAERAAGGPAQYGPPATSAVPSSSSCLALCCSPPRSARPGRSDPVPKVHTFFLSPRAARRGRPKAYAFCPPRIAVCW